MAKHAGDLDESEERLIADVHTGSATEPVTLRNLITYPIFWRTIGIVLLVNIACSVLTLKLVLQPRLPESRQQDSVFGNIGWREVVLDREEAFVESNPGFTLNGRTWNSSKTPWGDIFPSAWIEIADVTDLEVTGGASLSQWGSPRQSWTDGSEAYAVTMMHQVHCLALMKTVFMGLQQNETMDLRGHHIPHCIEYLRQTVLCNADMTLEIPTDRTSWPQGVTGWGSARHCRNWEDVIKQIKARALVRGPDGWVRPGRPATQKG